MPTLWDDENDLIAEQEQREQAKLDEHGRYCRELAGMSDWEFEKYIRGAIREAEAQPPQPYDGGPGIVSKDQLYATDEDTGERRVATNSEVNEYLAQLGISRGSDILDMTLSEAMERERRRRSQGGANV